jgi:hypothetical protein
LGTPEEVTGLCCSRVHGANLTIKVPFRARGKAVLTLL